jgi:formylglycine-generating enzyme
MVQNKFSLWLFVAALLSDVRPVLGQQPIVITSFNQNGALICTNLSPNSTATIQGASSPSGTWGDLFSLTVATDATITASVPVDFSGQMYYRVRGIANGSIPDNMALIPEGSFMMGAPPNGYQFEVPALTNIYVSLFYMDTNLVSYSLWQTVYNYATNHGYKFDNVGMGKGTNHPVWNVDWYDAVKWCNARSQLAGLNPVYFTDTGHTQLYTNGQYDTNLYPNWAANGYRLPTEAEWEKAARGGLSGLQFPWGNTIDESQANYKAEPGALVESPLGRNNDVNSYVGYNTNFVVAYIPYTSPVGYFAPNGYGLYDMAGNLQEWCWDWLDFIQYGLPTTNNPTGPAMPIYGKLRVLRGGDWSDFALYAQCFYHYNATPNTYQDWIGFRCVRGH